MLIKTPFHRALCLVADRCETTNLRAGRPSTPIVALECQTRQRSGCAVVAANYARGLTYGEFLDREGYALACKFSAGRNCIMNLPDAIYEGWLVE